MRRFASLIVLLLAAHLAWAIPSAVQVPQAVAPTMAQVQAAIAQALASTNPVLSIAPGATGHVVATRLDGTTTDMVPTLTGDASGSATSTAVAVQRPAYTSMSVATGATIQLPAGFAFYDLTGSGLVVAATVRLPPTPQDKQLARLIATGTLQISTLTVQDANGVAVGSTLGIGLLGTALYQYQGSTWQRVGT